MTGSLTVAEWGLIETPVYLTSTMPSAACTTARWGGRRRRSRRRLRERRVPVVGECDDSWLSDAARRPGRGRRCGRASPRRAAARSDRGRGGRRRRDGGFGWKGGIGTASRVGPSWRTHRRRTRARELGAPRRTSASTACRSAGLGRRASSRARPRAAASRSSPPTRRFDAQLTRVARRAGLGLAPHRLRRASRQRRDLPRLRDRGAGPRRGRSAPEEESFADADSTRLRGGRRRDRGGRPQRALGGARDVRSQRPRRPRAAARRVLALLRELTAASRLTPSGLSEHGEGRVVWGTPVAGIRTP